MKAMLSADIVKKVNAVYQWNIVDGSNKVISTWTSDLKNGTGSIYAGPAKGKADCTLTLSEDTLAGRSRQQYAGLHEGIHGWKAQDFWQHHACPKTQVLVFTSGQAVSELLHAFVSSLYWCCIQFTLLVSVTMIAL